MIEADFQEAVLNHRTEDKRIKLGAIYDKYADRLYRHALMILFDPSAAEDAVQQVFVKLLNRKEKAGAIESYETYLRRAVRNECFRIIKKQQVDRAMALSHVGDIIESVDKCFTGEQEKKAVTQALLEIPSEQREVIQMKVYEKMTFQQIAEILDISANTVASRYRYAMDKLRKLLL